MNTRQLLSAGKDLLSGNFEGAVKSLSGHGPLTFPVNSANYRGMPDGKQWFAEMVGSGFFYFQYSGHKSACDAYEGCPPVNAIINKKAQAFINGKTWVLNTQGKAKGKEAKTIEAKKLQKLFTQPNPIQNWEQFEAQGYIYQQLFGYTLLLSIKPVGFTDNIDATALWNIPPFMVDIEETNKLFYQTNQRGMIKEIVLTYKDVTTRLNVDDVYIMKDITPSFDSLIFPQSRICALELPINNIIGAFESRNVLINYRGALGILTRDGGDGGQYGALPLPEGEKENIQNDFRRYGLKQNQWQIIITSAAMKWQQMGYPTKDLMLFEEIEGSTQAICDGFNYQYELLSNNKGVTYANKNEAKKLVYQDAILPEAQSIYGQWNQFFSTAKYNLTIDKDFSHVAVLQEDQLQAAQARKERNNALLIEYQNDLITMNRWLELNGEDPRPDGDRYYSEIKREQNANQQQQQSGSEEGLQAEGEQGDSEGEDE